MRFHLMNGYDDIGALCKNCCLRAELMGVASTFNVTFVGQLAKQTYSYERDDFIINFQKSVKESF